jgi:hypothetical protein
MQETLHPTPRGRDVVREQIRVVSLALRPVTLVIAIVIGLATFLFARDFVRGHVHTWFDSDEWFPLAFLAFALPFAVWWRDRRFAPAFLWTLPVDRRRLLLAKVFAGWVWMAAALALFIVWHRALALVAGVRNPETVPLVAFIGTTATYLLGSALVAGVRYPLRWLLGAAGLVFLLRMLTEKLDPFGVDAFLRSNSLSVAYPTVSTLLPFFGLGAGLIALWIAASRHKENH